MSDGNQVVAEQETPKVGGEQKPHAEAPAAAEKASPSIVNGGEVVTEGKTDPVQESKPVEAVVPEKYEFKLPEGVSLDPEYVKGFEDFAKSNKMSNEQAQKALERENLFMSSLMEHQAKETQAVKLGWLEAAKNDKEIGGERLRESAELSKRVMDRFASNELKDALNETGLGNHPELIRLLSKIGKAMSDDSFVQSKTHSVKRLSADEVLYGSTNNKE